MERSKCNGAIKACHARSPHLLAELVFSCAKHFAELARIDTLLVYYNHTTFHLAIAAWFYGNLATMKSMKA